MSVSLKQNTWRVIDMIDWAREYFREKQFESPRLEIEGLLCDLLQCKRVDLYVRFEEPLTGDQLAILRGQIKRRLKHEPLQYITGTTEFYGYPLTIRKPALIPRPESERLVDVALELIPDSGPVTVLDVGCGSGCLSVALAKQRPNTHLLAIDVDTGCLELTKENLNLNSLPNVETAQVDIFDWIPDEPMDIVVSNPPYIPEQEWKNLMPEVKDHEPEHALTDHGNGLSFYRRFANIFTSLVKPGGWLVLEVGLGKHPEEAHEIFSLPEVESSALINDFNGDPRVLTVQRSDKTS